MESIQANKLLNSISDAVMAMGDDLVVTFFNRSAEEKLGRTREEIIGRPLFESFPEARGSIFEQKYRLALKEKRELSFETYFDVPPYINWYDVRVYPTSEGICVFFQTTSELKKLESDLKKVNQCMLSLGSDYKVNLESLTDLAGEVLSADAAVYRVLKGNVLTAVAHWNVPEELKRICKAQTDLCSEALLDSKDNYMLEPDLPNSKICVNNPVVRDCGLLSYLGHVITAGDIRIGVLSLYYKEHMSPSEDQLELLKIIASAFDGVEIRREKEQLLVNSNHLLQDALDHLKKVQDEVIKRERLSALGQMVSGIAHDFNNALMPVLGISDLLLHDDELLDDKIQLKKDLEVIYHSAVTASSTVKSLREFYRPISEEDFEPVDFVELISASVKATEHAWKIRAMDEERPIEMKVITGPMPQSTGNRMGLENVLSNLILNAVDAMPGGGTITVRGWHEDGYIYISVSDNGDGMSEEVKAHCLEPFYTTKCSAGTGMGLARSYGIISRHGGTMTVDSVPGRGTEVIVKLMRREPEEVSDKDEAQIEQDCDEPLSVLVVDDDERTRYLLEKLLKNQVGRLTVCCDGPKALASFEKMKHSIVITDKAMPGMDGQVLAGKIKKLAPQTPIIMLTGYGDLMGEIDSSMCVDLVLPKPITRQHLYEAIEKVARNKNPEVAQKSQQDWSKTSLKGELE